MHLEKKCIVWKYSTDHDTEEAEQSVGKTYQRLCQIFASAECSLAMQQRTSNKGFCVQQLEQIALAETL